MKHELTPVFVCLQDQSCLCQSLNSWASGLEDFSEEGSRSAHNHDHFSFAPAVEFTQKNSLPAAQQQLAVFERNRHGCPNEAGFDVRIRVFFAVTKAHAMLRNQRRK